MHIETERLVLRFWHEDDLNDFYEYASVDGVGERAGWKHHESVDESRKILQQMFVGQKDVLAVTLKSTGKVIGSVGFHELRSDWQKEGDYAGLNAREIGYVLSKDYWGRGLMTEAVKAVIGYCFNTLRLDVLFCGHYAENTQSKRVIEKCGFRFVKQAETYNERLQKKFDLMNYILYNGNR